MRNELAAHDRSAAPSRMGTGSDAAGVLARAAAELREANRELRTLAEGLMNVYRHARAASAAVRVARSLRTLDLELWDNGLGGADPMAGTGLRGLKDRIGALGGTLTLDSSRHAGTRLAVELPCAS
ncbi:hypothetical protein ABT381_03685 [Streptomyces sp. NPDC000151]|uniref:hypothetical protein n=1 Tax=Streptomyces sp. NPDC000151 TaxID=3154244 RepID=UPI0033224074